MVKMNVRLKGIFCIVASAFGFALMAMFVRLCDDYGESVSCFQKSFFRNLVALGIAAAVFASDKGGMRRIRGSVPKKGAFPLVLRCIFGTMGIFANFYALSHIPIAEGMALNKTAPLFTVLFSWLFLGEAMRPARFAWMLTAFAGVLMVMKPGFGGGGVFAMSCALGGGLFAGAAYSCLRQLGRLGVGGAFIVLFFSAFSCVASLPFLIFDFTPMSFAQVLILLGAGAGAAAGQFGITMAYRFAEPRSIAVYDYTNVIFTALLGLTFFDQRPDWISVAGFAVIMAAALKVRP